MAPENLELLRTVYGPTTWEVYDKLDQSLNPAGPDVLFDMAAELIEPEAVVLDAGSRNGAHLIELVRRFGVRGVGVEPVPLHVEMAIDEVRAAGMQSHIEIHEGALNQMVFSDDTIDFVWCRDVLEQVDDMPSALAELARVMRPGSAMLVYTTVVTARLAAPERDMLRSSLGNVDRNLDRAYLEAAFATAGFATESVLDVGTQWREYAEERTQPVSQSLLRLARLRRQEEEIVEEHGEAVFNHIEANLHWELFQFLGKLTSLVYVLRSP